ncbi:MAG: hypothetical protein C5S43_02580 [Candidatus Methanocomedens sp.]|nr:MAG: hypothetical protein C5S43_02580 [ANME-2 cluster archaeon]
MKNAVNMTKIITTNMSPGMVFLSNIIERVIIFKST